jgi:uncharacterized protein YjbI with pentapeptide repeats
MYTVLRTVSRSIKNQAKLIGGFLAGAIVVGGMSIAIASIPDANGVIHGCIRNNGDLRIIDSATQQCTNAQDPITFNQTGPQGPQGPVGTGGIRFVSNLAGVELSSVSWKFFDLGGLDFHGSTLSGDLEGSSLVGANFANVDFTHGLFMNRADAHGVNFSGGSFGSTFFAQNVNFSGANFTNATFSASDPMQRVNLTGATFSQATFTGTQFLPNSTNRITGGDFSNAHFTNANLDGIEFLDAIFTGVTWSNTVCPDGTNSNNNGNTCAGHMTP